MRVRNDAKSIIIACKMLAAEAGLLIQFAARKPVRQMKLLHHTVFVPSALLCTYKQNNDLIYFVTIKIFKKK